MNGVIKSQLQNQLIGKTISFMMKVASEALPLIDKYRIRGGGGGGGTHATGR